MTTRNAVPVAGIPTAPPLPAELDELLRRLRLPHIRRLAPEVIATAKSQRWDPAEILKVLFAEEAAGRARSALATRRAAAGFPTGKTFHAWQPELSSIPAPTQQALRTLEWIGRRENLVVCGPSGTGKTFLLEALGQQAVEAGLHVAWFTLENLGVLLRRHRADDTVSKAIARILRADLIVVDDIGLLAVPADAAEGLYRLVDAAYEKRSVAVSSNLHPFDTLEATAPHIRLATSCSRPSELTHLKCDTPLACSGVIQSVARDVLGVIQSVARDVLRSGGLGCGALQAAPSSSFSTRPADRLRSTFQGRCVGLGRLRLI